MVNVQKVVDKANKIMKMQVAPFIVEEVERQIKARIKPECLIDKQLTEGNKS